MQILGSSGLLVVLAASVMACSSSSGGTGGGGIGGTGGTGGAGGQAPVLGTECLATTPDCCNAWAKECGTEGGYLDTCMFGEHCPTLQYAIHGGSVCHPVTTPTTGQFACAYLACDAGQVCHYSKLAGDGCEIHECVAPPAPCDKTPTCACFMANGLLGDCTADASGNVTVTKSGTWP